MMENLNFILFILKFYIFWFFLILLGRSFLITLSFFIKKVDKPDNQKISNSSLFIFYPVLGIAFLGNFLFISHFFIPIGNFQLYLLILYIVILNFRDINRLKNFNQSLFNFSYYLLIPLILLVSSYDIAFHYDAGFYHLNHQNWLRESNLIIGIVNIFWPYGIGSIYEYISAFFWFDETFILLHFLNLVFIIFFYSFCLEHLIKIKNSFLKFPILFIIIFSFLDNFGLNGGRNGFFYIQGVTASDLVVGILFFITSLNLITRLRDFKFDILEFHIFTILILFLVEIKLSVVFISVLLFIYLYKASSAEGWSFTDILKILSPYIVLSIVWTIKSILTTGCLVFPLNFTCLNFISWYEAGSTKKFETISTTYSKAYIIGDSIADWFHLIYDDEIRKTVIVNFLVSFLLIYIFKKLFFTTRAIAFEEKSITFIFLIINFIYFVLAGPTPRYGIGLIMLIIACLGFNVESWKYNLNYKYFVYFLFFSGLIFTPKLDSYRSFNPTVEPTVSLPKIDYVSLHEQWVKPASGDKCWINLDCTLSSYKVEIDEEGFFKKVLKK
jgi:hypothetical protein